MIIILTLAKGILLNTFSVSKVYIGQNKSFHSFVLSQLFKSICEKALGKPILFDISLPREGQSSFLSHLFLTSN